MNFDEKLKEIAALTDLDEKKKVEKKDKDEDERAKKFNSADGLKVSKAPEGLRTAMEKMLADLYGDKKSKG